MVHELKKEIKIIEFFGYNLVGPNKSNQWTILDGAKKKVGYIQYRRLHNKDKENGQGKIFGYHTMINSNDFFCEFYRELTDAAGNIISDIDFKYEFVIKRSDGKVDYAEINMDFPQSLLIWSNNFGNINFNNRDGLYINFKTETESYNVAEILFYKNSDDKSTSKYTYQISYCKKPLELTYDNPNGRTTRQLVGTADFSQREQNQLSLMTRTWVNAKIKSEKRTLVSGNVEEMARMHQTGIERFNYFRKFVNQVVPINSDVIYTLMSKELIIKDNLGLFFPELKKQKGSQKILKKPAAPIM